tara:strand:+ start:333 stop:890 length:558 start_codon:yes stop_codon:yes gene_type:complete
MSIVPIVTFIEIYDSELVPASGDISNAVQHRFQNSEPSSSGIQWSGPDENHTTNKKFDFLSFIYQGATRSNDGSNLESALVLANESNNREGSLGANKLSMSYAAEAVNNGWSVRVSTCQMTDTTFSAVKTVLAFDIWKIASMGYDNATIELLLSSSIDAIGSNTGRFLTSSLVGHLPVTARIQTR